MRTLLQATTLATSLLAVSAVLSPETTLAHDWTGECLVDFDSLFALTNTYAQARSTFAVPTAFSSSETLDTCKPDSIACWTYRHRCSSSYVNLDDFSGYGHLHLSFTNPGFDGSCGFGDPGDGYGVGMRKRVPGTSGPQGCVTPDWKQEPRLVNTHEAGHWLRFFLEDSVEHLPKVFDMTTIRIGPSVPVQLWFRNSLDEWWYWPSLGANWWDVSPWMHDVVEVRFRAADGEIGPITIEDFHIRD